MPRYWVIAPFSANDAGKFRTVWSHDIENELISIGWEGVGSIAEKSLEEVNSIIRENYSNYSKGQVTRVANMLWTFHKEISVGDVVIARRGRSVIAGIGEVLEVAEFVVDGSLKAEGIDYDHARILRVRWRAEGRELTFPSMVFGMQTIYEVEKEKYETLVEGDYSKIGIEPKEEEAEIASEFVLEKYLESFLVSNFTRIFGDNLKLYNDPVDNGTGQQFTTEVGIIDLLAQELDSGDLVVIELKKGKASDKVVGQILRYMGWVQENLAIGTQKVKGIIICHEQDERLSYSVKMVPNISLKFYQVQFTLKDAI